MSIMQFNPENPVVKLCAAGMEKEGEGRPGEAASLFLQAWNLAGNDMERFIAAHYVARHQKTVTDKLRWDEQALSFALKVGDPDMHGTLPSLYLNIAKCYEDMNDRGSALKNYQLAHSFSSALSDDGYGRLIRAGIDGGLKRVAARISEQERGL